MVEFEANGAFLKYLIAREIPRIETGESLRSGRLPRIEGHEHRLERRLIGRRRQIDAQIPRIFFRHIGDHVIVARDELCTRSCIASDQIRVPMVFTIDVSIRAFLGSGKIAYRKTAVFRLGRVAVLRDGHARCINRRIGRSGVRSRARSIRRIHVAKRVVGKCDAKRNRDRKCDCRRSKPCEKRLCFMHIHSPLRKRMDT